VSNRASRVKERVIEGFDGHSVSLKIQKQELDRFRSDQGKGFSKVKIEQKRNFSLNCLFVLAMKVTLLDTCQT
jgi:hypothetical protein